MEEQTTAGAEVPLQRTCEAPRRSADVLRSLGIDALVEMIERSAYGVVVTDEHHRWLYLNPAGCRTVARPLEDLQGEDYTLSFSEHERAALLGLEEEQREGDTEFYTNTLVRPDGTEVGITWSGTVVTVDGRELAPAFFHTTSAVRVPAREAAALGAAAAHISAGGSLADVLASLAAEAVDGSRAAACLIAVADDDERLRIAAHVGIAAGAAAQLEAAQLRLSDLPGGDRLAAGRLLLLSDGRERMAAQQATQALAHSSGVDWQGSAKVPLHRAGHVVGVLVLLLPRGVTAPSEQELTVWSALGAHASAALAEERLRTQAAAHAAELERQRLGRDLHDSVSAALFSLHARAQVVRRALAVGKADLAAEAAQDMELLSRQAIAELRETVTDLRSPTGDVDLVAAVTELARTTTARGGVAVAVRTPGAMPHLPAATAEHLLRIAAEAVHNCVKHAGASRASIELDQVGGELLLAVRDDGCGFDVQRRSGGDRHGLRTMRERAVLCGGSLLATSAVGRGTSVVVRVPLAS